MGDFGEWYRSIPLITRYWFTGATVIPLMGRFGLFSPYLMLLDFELFFYKFQLWRPLTALFYYPVTPQTGFHWLLMCYFLYNYSKDTETSAVYLPWVLVAFNMVLRGGGINELIGILVGHTYYFLAFQYALDYGGSVIIKTPQFLYNYLPNRVGGFAGFGSVPQNRTATNRGGATGGGGHNWGTGRELGGEQR
uniref:Derlin n=1 Tax=Meloidogyne javanica TaxID=6303 RepID=A0A915M2H2_MELJA